MKTKNVLIAVAVVLGILLLLAFFWGMQQKNKNKELAAQNTELSGELNDLEELKQDLEIEIDSLQQEYEVLYEENESLAGSLSEAEEEIARKAAEVRNAKRAGASEVNNLKAEIQELLAIKGELENSIQDMQMENDSLRAVAGLLEADLSVARADNQALTNLNRTIQGELEKLTLENFKASAFSVEVESKKSGKATAKSGKARRIRVSFDLAGVPEEYQGMRTIYLAISDDKGTPIKAENPVQARVKVGGQPMDLIAIAARDENISESQRLNFNHELAEKLRPGFYRASVYTDVGLLGASSFRLQ